MYTAAGLHHVSVTVSNGKYRTVRSGSNECYHHVSQKRLTGCDGDHDAFTAQTYKIDITSKERTASGRRR